MKGKNKEKIALITVTVNYYMLGGKGQSGEGGSLRQRALVNFLRGGFILATFVFNILSIFRYHRRNVDLKSI